MELESNNHSVFLMHYHLVLVVKYRRRVITDAVSDRARFVYNRMLADKIAHYEKTGEMLKVTPARYKREFPWLKEVDSFALCNAQLNLDAAYRNFFRRVKAG